MLCKFKHHTTEYPISFLLQSQCCEKKMNCNYVTVVENCFLHEYR